MSDTPSEAMTADIVRWLIKTQHDAANQGCLAIWTVYDHPSDYPDAYLARMHEVPGGPTALTLLGEPEFLRKWFQAAGLHCLARDDDDDKKIVETWV